MEKKGDQVPQVSEAGEVPEIWRPAWEKEKPEHMTLGRRTGKSAPDSL